MNIDWSVAPEGFDYYLIGQSLAEPGKVYMKVDSVQRYISSSGSFVAFEDAGEFEIHRRPAWTGEGRPPVGSMVVIDSMGLTIWPDAEQFIGPNVMVLANYKAGDEEMIVVESPDERSNCCFRACMARPIRTPEQIAAEERNKAQNEIKEIILANFKIDPITASGIAGVISDYDYRKEVKS